MIIPSYNSIPKGYGVAYRKYDMDAVVAYPIPFNIFVALFRRVYIWFLHGAYLYKDGFDKGYKEGYSSGREYAFNQFKTQTIRQEVPAIIKNFLEKEKSIIEKHGYQINGWILDFIEEEQKRLSK